MNENGPWEFLPHFVIRSTGFPLEWLEQLALEKSIQLCREAVDRQERLEHLRSSALEFLNSYLPSPEERKALRAVRKSLDQLLPLPPESAALTQSSVALQEWNEQVEALRHLKSQAGDIFQEELTAKRQGLRELASTEKFQEAVYLSSPDMYRQSLRTFLETSDPKRRLAADKRLELKAFSYLQRFCGKNETASYFGPVNYGTITENPDHLDYARSGPGRIRQRETFFSYWGVALLAETIGKDESVRPYIAPRINPVCRLERDSADIQVADVRVKLRPVHLHVLAHVDGKRDVNQLAAVTGLSAGDLAALLAALTRAGVILHRIDIPTNLFHPLSYLHRFVQDLPEGCSGRLHWLNVLEQMESYRLRFGHSSFGERRAILSELEASFESVTGQEGRRGSGRIYADRALLYEECQGTIERFACGQAFHERLTQQLAGAFELSALVGKHLWLHYQELARQALAKLAPDGSPVPYAKFLAHTRESRDFASAPPPCPWVERLRDALGQWHAEHPGGRVYECSSASLAFEREPGPLYSLPDIAIAAANTDAIARGDYTVVLARLHHHLLLWGWLFCFHDSQEQIEAALQRFLANHDRYRRLVHLQVSRRNKGFYDFPGRSVEYASRSDRPDQTAICLSDVYVVQSENQVVIRQMSTGEDLTLYLSLADQVGYMPFHAFALPDLTQVNLIKEGHTPRILIDQAVVQRESWQIPAEQCGEFKESHGVDLLLSAERFRRRHQMPEWVYVRTNLERKPYVIHFRNFFAIELLQSVVRRGGTLLIQEMLPAPDQLWLQDEQGRYSTELRMNCFKVT